MELLLFNGIRAGGKPLRPSRMGNRFMKKNLAAALLLFVLVLSAAAEAPPILAEGDIVFQTSRSSQSLAIQLATRSKYSHMGIVFREKGEFHVYEAVQPVKKTRLGEWIKRGEGGKYVLKRLKDSALLTPQTLAKMKKVAAAHMGKNYDASFEWNDKRLYCSELVWKIYRHGAGVEVGRLQKLGDFDLNDKRVKAKLRERFGQRIPLDETVISPAAIFESELLFEVWPAERKISPRAPRQNGERAALSRPTCLFKGQKTEDRGQ
jgi:hypothetical protein